MNNELAPGVLAIVVGLVQETEFNGMCVELYVRDPAVDGIFYDPIDNCYYGLHEDDLLLDDGDWWGCICPSVNRYLFFRSCNLLPIGKKDSHKEDTKDFTKEDSECF